MQVLIVDDDFVTRRLLQARLVQMGLHVIEAVNGKEAWELLQANPIPLVITDWLMPLMDGLNLIQQIRAANFPRYIYVILLTNLDSKTDVVKGLEAGADDYLTKPFNLPELTARVKIGQRIVALEQRLLAMSDQLYIQATYDQLTGLLQRSAALEQLNLLVQRAQGQQQPLSLLLLDLDHFKQINDQHGHTVGDQALRLIAEQIQQTVRTSDPTARWGGEEMLVLLPGANSSAAIATAQRIRRAIGGQQLDHALPSSELSASIGIAVLEPGSSTDEPVHSIINRLLSQADQALYAAKNAGRNCCALYAEPQPLIIDKSA